MPKKKIYDVEVIVCIKNIESYRRKIKEEKNKIKEIETRNDIKKEEENNKIFKLSFD